MTSLIHIDRDGTKRWHLLPLPDNAFVSDEGQLYFARWHRVDGPAIEWASGNRGWYLNGKAQKFQFNGIEYIVKQRNGSIESIEPCPNVFCRLNNETEEKN